MDLRPLRNGTLEVSPLWRLCSWMEEGKKQRLSGQAELTWVAFSRFDRSQGWTKVVSKVRRSCASLNPSSTWDEGEASRTVLDEVTRIRVLGSWNTDKKSLTRPGMGKDEVRDLLCAF